MAFYVAVASLPPEQMFELMKQMKECIVNNPQEARDMLLKNPQLAYALLQALVVMKIVDPEMAISMLHKQAPKPMLIQQNERYSRYFIIYFILNVSVSFWSIFVPFSVHFCLFLFHIRFVFGPFFAHFSSIFGS